MQEDDSSHDASSGEATPLAAQQIPRNSSASNADEEVGVVATRKLTSAAGIPTSMATADETELQTRGSSSIRSIGSWASRRRLPFFGNGGVSSPTRLNSKLAALVDAYERSDVAADISRDRNEPAASGVANDVEAVVAFHGYRRATGWTQFTILSGRAFKNLYRNPMLMLSHYAVSILIARA